MSEDVRNGVEQRTNPVKAIRAKCLYDCCNGSKVDVDECTVTKCQLYPFRFGRNPYRSKREMSEEQKNKAAARLEKARQQKNAE